MAETQAVAGTQGAVATGAAFWCYQCNAEVHPPAQEGSQEAVCPLCGSGFIEDLRTADVRAAQRGRRAGGRGNRHTGRNALQISLRLLNQLDEQQLGQLAPLFRGFTDGGQAQNRWSELLQRERADDSARGERDHVQLGEGNQASDRSPMDMDGNGDSRSTDPAAANGQIEEVHQEQTNGGSNTGDSVERWEQEESGEQEDAREDSDRVEIPLGDLENLELELDIDDEWGSMSEDEEDWEDWVEDEEGEAGEAEHEDGDVEEDGDDMEMVEGSDVPQDSEGREEESDGRQTAEEEGGAQESRRQGQRLYANVQLPRGTLAGANLAATLQQLLQNLEIRVDRDRGIVMVGDAGGLYVGNPGDYLDAQGMEAFLQHLAANDTSQRGPPPASKAVVEALPSMAVKTEDIQNGFAQCAICKDLGGVGESLTQLPCSHLYHADCIKPWLSTRNSCPLCRYELPTDDADYEEQRRRRESAADGASDRNGRQSQSDNQNPSMQAGETQLDSQNPNLQAEGQPAGDVAVSGPLDDTSTSSQVDHGPSGGSSGRNPSSQMGTEQEQLGAFDGSSASARAGSSNQPGEVVSGLAPEYHHGSADPEAVSTDVDMDHGGSEADGPLALVPDTADVATDGDSTEATEEQPASPRHQVVPSEENRSVQRPGPPQARGLLGFVRLAAHLAGLLLGLYVSRRLGDAISSREQSQELGDAREVELEGREDAVETRQRRRRWLWLF